MSSCLMTCAKLWDEIRSLISLYDLSQRRWVEVPLPSGNQRCNEGFYFGSCSLHCVQITSQWNYKTVDFMIHCIPQHHQWTSHSELTTLPHKTHLLNTYSLQSLTLPENWGDYIGSTTPINILKSRRQKTIRIAVKKKITCANLSSI